MGRNMPGFMLPDGALSAAGRCTESAPRSLNIGPLEDKWTKGR
jgi:hypothetical protein